MVRKLIKNSFFSLHQKKLSATNNRNKQQLAGTRTTNEQRANRITSRQTGQRPPAQIQNDVCSGESRQTYGINTSYDMYLPWESRKVQHRFRSRIGFIIWC